MKDKSTCQRLFLQIKKKNNNNKKKKKKHSANFCLKPIISKFVNDFDNSMNFH